MSKPSGPLLADDSDCGLATRQGIPSCGGKPRFGESRWLLLVGFSCGVASEHGLGTPAPAKFYWGSIKRGAVIALALGRPVSEFLRGRQVLSLGNADLAPSIGIIPIVMVGVFVAHTQDRLRETTQHVRCDTDAVGGPGA